MNYSSSPLDSSTNSGSSRWLKVLGLRFLEGEYLGKDVTFEEGEGATETAGPDGIASNSCPDGVGWDSVVSGGILPRDVLNAVAAKDVAVPIGVAAVPDLKMRPSIRLVDIRLGNLENSTVWPTHGQAPDTEGGFWEDLEGFRGNVMSHPLKIENMCTFLVVSKESNCFQIN